MSQQDHEAKQVAEVAMGAFQELARQGGMQAGAPHGIGRLGEYAVKGVAAVAPVVAAKASVVAAATVATATAAAPLAAVAGVGLGAYWLYKKFRE